MVREIERTTLHTSFPLKNRYISREKFITNINSQHLSENIGFEITETLLKKLHSEKLLIPAIRIIFDENNNKAIEDIQNGLKIQYDSNPVKDINCFLYEYLLRFEEWKDRDYIHPFDNQQNWLSNITLEYKPGNTINDNNTYIDYYNDWQIFYLIDIMNMQYKLLFNFKDHDIIGKQFQEIPLNKLLENKKYLSGIQGDNQSPSFLNHFNAVSEYKETERIYYKKIYFKKYIHCSSSYSTDCEQKEFDQYMKQFLESILLKYNLTHQTIIEFMQYLCYRYEEFYEKQKITISNTYKNYLSYTISLYQKLSSDTFDTIITKVGHRSKGAWGHHPVYWYTLNRIFYDLDKEEGYQTKKYLIGGYLQNLNSILPLEQKLTKNDVNEFVDWLCASGLGYICLQINETAPLEYGLLTGYLRLTINIPNLARSLEVIIGQLLENENGTLIPKIKDLWTIKENDFFYEYTASKEKTKKEGKVNLCNFDQNTDITRRLSEIQSLIKSNNCCEESSSKYSPDDSIKRQHQRLLLAGFIRNYTAHCKIPTNTEKHILERYATTLIEVMLLSWKRANSYILFILICISKNT